MGTAYSAIAKVYDRLMKDFDYEGYYSFVKEHIKGDAVELGCGSGKFTLLYLSRVNSVLACDISRDMLDIASSKCLRYRKIVQLVESDMTNLTPYRNADTVLAVCDAFNYLSKEQLRVLIKKISGYMSIGGKLIFDISSQFKLKNIIGDNVFYEDYQDITYIWTNKLNDESVDMDITVFEKQGELYHRTDESQTQYIHDVGTVIKTLERYGFKSEVYDGESYKEAGINAKRLLFISTLLSKKEK